jgi:hypothetical protein
LFALLQDDKRSMSSHGYYFDYDQRTPQNDLSDAGTAARAASAAIILNVEKADKQEHPNNGACSTRSFSP